MKVDFENRIEQQDSEAKNFKALVFNKKIMS